MLSASFFSSACSPICSTRSTLTREYSSGQLRSKIHWAWLGVGLGRVPHDIDELDFARALASRVSCAAKALETRLGVKSNHRLGECRSTYFYFVLLRDFLKVSNCSQITFAKFQFGLSKKRLFV